MAQDRTIALAISPAVLVVLVEVLLLLRRRRRLLLSAILGIVTLLIVLLLLVLRLVLSKLARLEILGRRLEGGDAWSETSLRLGGVLGVQVELLLSLTGEVLVLGGRIIFPRVEVRHDEFGFGRDGDGSGRCGLSGGCVL